MADEVASVQADRDALQRLTDDDYEMRLEQDEEEGEDGRGCHACVETSVFWET